MKMIRSSRFRLQQLCLQANPYLPFQLPLLLLFIAKYREGRRSVSVEGSATSSSFQAMYKPINKDLKPHRPYLEVQNNGPDQAQGQLGVAICDVIVANIH